MDDNIRFPQRGFNPRGDINQQRPRQPGINVAGTGAPYRNMTPQQHHMSQQQHNYGASSLPYPPQSIYNRSTQQYTGQNIQSSQNTTPTKYNTSSTPAHMEYSAYNKRFDSFRYVMDKFTQTTEHLSEAGLFYQGPNDSVSCYMCGGGMRNWEATDTPWEEHARHYPQCHWVKTTKGDQFIYDTMIKHGMLQEAAQLGTPQTPQQYLPQPGAQYGSFEPQPYKSAQGETDPARVLSLNN